QFFPEFRLNARFKIEGVRFLIEAAPAASLSHAPSYEIERPSRCRDGAQVMAAKCRDANIVQVAAPRRQCPIVRFYYRTPVVVVDGQQPGFLGVTLFAPRLRIGRIAERGVVLAPTIGLKYAPGRNGAHKRERA